MLYKLNLNDRREYSRVVMNDIRAAVFINHIEFTGIINDICEDGICVRFDKFVDVGIGVTISFQYIDDLFELEEVITGEAVVIRVANTEKNTVVGCRIINDDFYKYVCRRKAFLTYKKQNKFKDIKQSNTTFVGA